MTDEDIKPYIISKKIPCENCGQTAHLMYTANYGLKGGFMVLKFQCPGCDHITYKSGNAV